MNRQNKCANLLPKSSSNPLAPVKSLPRPQKVPPPVAVPPILSKLVSEVTFMTDTPEPIVTLKNLTRIIQGNYFSIKHYYLAYNQCSQ